MGKATRKARVPVTVLIGVLATLAASCTSSGRRPGAVVTLETAAVAVLVVKAERRLLVYKEGRPTAVYRVVLGHNPLGHKRYQGDARTPEGVYRITGIRRHERWNHFIDIDYPNDTDRQTYGRLLSEGLVPELGGRLLPPGSGLGIHGNDRPEEQAAGRDWTQGCVAMDNGDLAELVGLVGPGTPVFIRP